MLSQESSQTHKAMPMFSQTQTTSNTISSHSAFNYKSIPRTWLPEDEYKTTKRQHHLAAEQIIKEKNYRGNGRLIFQELVNVIDLSFVSRVGQNHFVKKFNVSRVTVSNWFKRFKADGVILYEEAKTWGNDTNITTMLALKHKLSLVCKDSLTDLTLTDSHKDEYKHNTYDAYVSLLANSDKKQKKKPPRPYAPRSEKHICNDKLKAEPEKEIKRAIKAHGLTKDFEEYVCNAMRTERNINNPARYLGGILRDLKSGKRFVIDTHDYGLEAKSEKFKLELYAAINVCKQTDGPVGIGELLKGFTLN